MAGSVLVVDDQPGVRRALSVELSRADFDVIEARDGLEGWDQFREHQPDLVITDLVMPRSDGQEFLERIAAESDVPVLLYSSRATVRTAVDAIRAGAIDFLSAADSSIEEIVESARRAVQSRRSQNESILISNNLVGSSDAMNRLRERVQYQLPLRTPLLVLGQPGTGRRSVVRLVHELGGEVDEIEMVECALEPDRRPEDTTGPVYLRGIEHLSVDTQRAWAEELSIHESRSFQECRRLYASSVPAVATIGQSKISEDLCRKLRPHSLTLPTLQERHGDIPELAEALVQDLAKAVRRDVRLSRGAHKLLEGQNWPGQLHQLRELLQKAVTYSPGREIQEPLVQELLRENELSIGQFRSEHSRQERERLINAMRETGGNIRRTAELLDKSRPAVYRLLKKYEL